MNVARIRYVGCMLLVTLFLNTGGFAQDAGATDDPPDLRISKSLANRLVEQLVVRTGETPGVGMADPAPHPAGGSQPRGHGTG